jgi:uncharacterized integral membrane protein
MAPPPNPNRTRVARLVLVIVVVAVLVAFILGNSERVRISFVFFHARFSLIWALLVTNLLGFVAGYLLANHQGRPQSKP